MPEKFLADALSYIPFCMVGDKIKLNTQRLTEIVIAAVIIGWIASMGVAGIKSELKMIKHDVGGLKDSVAEIKASVAEIREDFYKPRIADE